MKTTEPAQVSAKETETLLTLLSQCLPLAGDVVEFGCYRGDTSVLFQKLIQKSQTPQNPQAAETLQTASTTQTPQTPSPRLWLYDSFAGLPPKSREDSSVAGDQFQSGELFVTKKEVVLKFKRAGLRVPIIKKAFFEDLDPTTDLPEQISFAFLDGDLYQSIKTSLKLVAPRLVERGIIVIHDYNNPELPGASRAVDEFLREHPLKLKIVETLAICYN